MNKSFANEIQVVLSNFFPRLKPQSVAVNGNAVSIVADDCDKVQVAKFLLKRYPALYWVHYESKGAKFIYNRDTIRIAEQKRKPA